MTSHDLLPPDRVVVTLEEEPVFRLPASDPMPVSRDLPPREREVIIREMKRVDLADAAGSLMIAVCFLATIFGLIACLGFLLYIVAKFG